MPHRTHAVSVEFDELTDLPSMLYFRRYAGAYARRAHARGRKVYLVYFNVENFSTFNARYGFEEGDNLLCFTANALREAFPGFLLSRFSEDHFLLVCESLNIERGILEAREQLHVFGRHANVELKAGIFVLEDDQINIGVACDRAKTACDSISHRYDRSFRYYDDALSWYDERRHYIENNIDHAIKSGWIKVFYQPIVRSVTGEVCEFEALARWEDPVYGMLSPAVFVEVLERARLIHKLDAHVTRLVCAEWQRLSESSPWRVPVSINLSRLDFELCDTFEMVNSVATQFRIPHQMLHIEVTESALNDDRGLLYREIQRFREANYQVWLDDFGSGYSSLNTLKDYTFDVIKIDMVFLREFDAKPQSRVIIASVVNMAKQLGMQTLIEGVETPEQFDFLREIGCEFMQGYLIGRPVPSELNIERIDAGELVMEEASLHGYYDRIGGINLLSATPFEFTWEAPLEERPFAEMLPLATIEIVNGRVGFMTSNDAFVEVLREVGLGSMAELAERINNDADRQAHAVGEALRAAVSSDAIESVDVLENGRHCAMRIRHVVSREGVDALLVSLINLSRFSDVTEERLLHTVLRYVYTVYDLVNLIDRGPMTMRTIFRGNTSFPTASRDVGVAEVSEHFANAFIHPKDRERYCRFMDLSTLDYRVARSAKGHLSDAFRALNPQGIYRWITCELLPIVVEDSEVVLLCMRGANQEVVDTINGEDVIPKSLLWDTLINLVPAGVFWKDADRRFVGVNQNFLDFYEFESTNDVLGKNDEEMGWHVDEGPFMDNEIAVIKHGEPVLNAWGTCIAQGEVHDIVASKIPLWRNGEVIGLMGYFTDQTGGPSNVSGTRILGDRFERMQKTDQLTGIANFGGFASSALSYEEAFMHNGTDFACAVASIRDLDGLNTVYGSVFGNRILKVVSQKLEQACGVSSVVARLGSDRFGVLYQTDDAKAAQREALRLQSVVDGIVEVDGIAVNLAFSLGWALYSETRDLMETLHVAVERMHEARA